ncbi:hypothetical protein E2C01_001565 [Portunus trituberculatus]|uniref:Uncharacterized protein n=1 Tax=Portunus trituberculatus TaxID=210409 RepID=A0A5B7CKR3_PORTR|nr:hypothetical protein [Portunus trituberculatus]
MTDPSVLAPDSVSVEAEILGPDAPAQGPGEPHFNLPVAKTTTGNRDAESSASPGPPSRPRASHWEGGRKGGAQVIIFIELNK